MYMRTGTAIGLALLAGTLAPATATAQDEASAQDQVYDNVIIVTARFREENLQDVPLDITAFDAEAIEERSIESLEDVARFTPGLTFETLEGSGGAPTIRGVSALSPSDREQPTAIFFDNVYLPRTYLFDSTTELLSRLEVVKGPQSSRFGRNAFSGAINYIPKKATLNGNSGEAFVTIGTDERFDIGGNLNFVAIPDRLAMFLAVSHTEFDGSWENGHPFADFGFSPGTNGNAGGRNNETIYASAIIEPVDSLTIEVSYLNTQIREEANAARYFLVNGPDDVGIGNCGPDLNGYPRLFCGVAPVPDEAVVEPRGFGRQADSEILRASLKYDVNDQVTLNYLFSNIKADSLSAFQSESDPINCGTTLPAFIFSNSDVVCNFQATPLGSIDYTAHELRLSYDNDDGALFGLGAYYLDGDDFNRFISAAAFPLDEAFPARFEPLNLNGANTGPAGPFPFAVERFFNQIQRESDTNTESFSLFGEVSYGFNDDRTRVSAEGRYTWEKIDTINTLTGVPVGPSPRTFKFFTPRFTIEQDITQDSLVYVSAARGAKAGGFNANAFDPDIAGSFEPEYNWTYELGMKNTLLDGAMTLNLAAFYTDWTNLQQRILDPSNPGPAPTTLTSNLGDVEVYGVEAALFAEITDGFSVDANAAYIISEFGSDAIDLSVVRQGISTDISGNTLPRSPRFAAGFGMQYDGEIDADTSYFIRADGSYQTNQFADFVNFVENPSRFLASARAGIEYRNYSVDLWVKNLFDKEYASASNVFYQNPPFNTKLGSILGERRTLGLSARVRF